VRGYVHVFTVWIVAIVVAGLIARALMREETPDNDDTQGKSADPARKNAADDGVS
jgi:hypothetical protein